MSRFARINKSAAALIAGQLLQIVAQLVVTPLYVRAWGATVFGVWLTLSAAVSYLAQADLGVTAYVLPRLMKHFTEGDWEKLEAEMHNATAAFFGLIGTCVVAGGLLAGGALWLQADADPVLIALLLGMQALVAISQYFVAMPYSVVSRPQRSYAQATWYAAALLATNLTVLLCHGTPLQLAAAQLALASARFVFTWIDAARVAPRVRPGLSRAHWPDAVALLPRSVERALAGLATLLTQQGTLLAVSGALGAASAAVFATQRTLVNFARMPQLLIASAVYVELADVYLRGDHALGARLLRLATAATIACTFPFLGVLAVYSPEVYAVWMKGRLTPDLTLFAWLCLEVTVLMPLYMIRTVLLSTNQHRASVWVEVATIAAVLVATACLAGSWGAWVAPASAVALQAPAFGFAVLREARRVLSGVWRPRSFAASFAKGLVLAAASLGVCLALRFAIDSALARIVVGFGVATAIGLAGLWFWLVTDEDRQLINARVAGYLGSSRA